MWQNNLRPTRQLVIQISLLPARTMYSLLHLAAHTCVYTMISEAKENDLPKKLDYFYSHNILSQEGQHPKELTQTLNKPATAADNTMR